MKGPFEGGCLCGRVRYRAAGPARFGILCFCIDCQRASGSGHVPILGLDKAGFRVEGEPACFTSTGGSGKPTNRNYCRDCGSLLYGTPTDAPDLVTLYAGSLDDPSVFRATDAIHTRHRNAWDTGGAGLATHEFARGA
ncbi:MAG: GFA family protein [Pseudomonadota bacterium]|nr:GFA family protein [Pseudomonadota bacterium]